MAQMLRHRRALTGDPTMAETAARVATGNDRLSAAEQVEIYREQFWLRHTSCLVDDFAGLGGVLGQADWERLVEEYLEDNPPLSFNLRDLGDRLPAFVEAATWLPQHELCVDMARVEWCYVEVFDAADAAPLDPAALATIPEEKWPSAVLTLSPALRLLRVRYPVARLRKNIRDGSAAPATIEREAQNLVIYRGADLNLYHQTLSNAAFAVLEQLRDGLALVPACERAAESNPSFATEIESNVGAWFQDWAARAWIVGVTLPGD